MSGIHIQALAAWLALVGVAAVQAADEKLTPEQRMITAAPLPSSDLKLDLWIDKTNGVYGAGESVQIYARASADAYVTIFNVNARGETTVVFPNSFHKQNFVQAGQLLQVPGPREDYQLTVNAPYGVNLIKALATKRQVSLFESSQLMQNGAFRTFQGGPKGLARQLQLVAKKEPRAGWGEAQLPFTVAPSAVTAGVPSVIVAPVAPPPPSALSGIPALDELLSARGGFRLQIAMQRDDYRAGEPLSLTAVAEKDCQLTLVDVDERRLGTVLLPNRFEDEDKTRALKAGVTQFLPSNNSNVQYSATGEGRHALVGFCVAEKPGFWSSLFGKSRAQSRAAVTVLGASDFATAIAEIAKQPAENVARAAIGYRVKRAR